MAATKGRRIVRGSERSGATGREVGNVNPDDRIEVTIRVRPRPSAGGPDAPAGADAPMTRAELAAAMGADPADIELIERFAFTFGLDVVETDAAQRKVVLGGPASAMMAAFGVTLKKYRRAEGTFRGRTGPVTIPNEIADVIEGVFGLDDRPQAAPHFRRSAAKRAKGSAKGGAKGARARSGARVAPKASGTASFSPTDLAKLYHFPPTADGSGQCIAIIELGGGFRAADLVTYFHDLPAPLPSITAVSVDGGQNSPSTPDSADGEVMLDIEVAGAVAPGATIAVYFAPNTDRGFLDAITMAVHDQVRAPSIISISWGAAESQWTAQAMQAMDQAFQEAGALGVTVFCAAGDDGSRDGVKDGKAHADFPATSPNVVACGGTKLSAAGGVITDEVTWNDGAGGGAGGGGISDVFDLPTYQAAAGVPKSANGSRVGRGVPDVAADASPASGYDVRVDGQNLVFGGTSAVAPLMAGLTARLNQALGKPVGFVNPALYGQAASAGAFVDITSGSIGAYTAKAGWDACTGLGRPDGDKLLAALEGPPPAPPSSSSRIGTLTVAAGQSSATQANVVLTSKARIFAELAGDGAGGDVPGVWVRSAVPSSDGRSFEVHLNEAVPAGSQAVVAWMIRSA